MKPPDWLRPPEPNRAAALENFKSTLNGSWAVFSMEYLIFEICLATASNIET